jgi:hypothetical protein
MTIMPAHAHLRMPDSSVRVLCPTGIGTRPRVLESRPRAGE